MLLRLLQVLQGPAASHQTWKSYSMFLHDLDHPNSSPWRVTQHAGGWLQRNLVLPGMVRKPLQQRLFAQLVRQRSEIPTESKMWFVICLAGNGFRH